MCGCLGVHTFIVKPRGKHPDLQFVGQKEDNNDEKPIVHDMETSQEDFLRSLGRLFSSIIFPFNLASSLLLYDPFVP